MTAPTMKAIVVKEPGGAPESMFVERVPLPSWDKEEVLIKVYATALNRADTLQRKGAYPAPPGASTIMGLECAGVIEEVGSKVPSKGEASWKKGDRVMCLLSGGGYAEYVNAHYSHCMPIPAHLSFEQAAAIPETWLTAFQLLHTIAKIQKDDWVLIHAGASGVGTAAIRLVLQAGGHPVVTVGSVEKLDYCRSLGAVGGFVYKTSKTWGKDLAVKMQMNGKTGVDIILDCVGASHSAQNFEAIGMDGRWVLFGLMGGGTVENYPLSQILRKRISLTGTTLRARSIAYKTALVKSFQEIALPAFLSAEERAVAGEDTVVFDPVIALQYPSLDKMAEAHTFMEKDSNAGKIVVTVLIPFVPGAAAIANATANTM